ncbi:MAG TPA: hypothetical protein VFE24_15305 [Pirellulales bacterium]|jgi:hypothetical protein|nr:hypothetical protein [Pirellulales bacterium]
MCASALPRLCSLVSLALLAWLGGNLSTASAADRTAPITFSGGHELGQNDFGRPCVLMAAALGVQPDVFREAFRAVHPARDGRPSGDEQRKNKAALLKVLGPQGVTNERMDEVANYYRFQPAKGEIWPTQAARAHAVIENGQIKRIVVTEPGSGYCTEPRAAVEGYAGAKLKVTLGLSKDFKLNGSIHKIEIAEKESPGLKSGEASETCSR